MGKVALRFGLRSGVIGPRVLTPRVFASRAFRTALICAKNGPDKPAVTSRSNTPAAADKKGSVGPSSAKLAMDKPQLMIAFTCKKCDTRSSHTISKQAYTGGTVLIQCPGCQNRHLIADHLKIFADSSVTIEDIMRARGETVAQTTEDLVLEDIPEQLKGTLSKYARDNKGPDTDSH
ncbi:Zim17p KNAG_0K02460 [Huiozyma naganishii CBS 8797]|uniref:DNL-type domain-containing protein n=1 Tax=Huiozyma naganishii (strain ATCC MYA-139 / BCRC 22969 / CBS 8797 / KCTC 17520 / NBRC 10181 / NCYC 3082 / Yp74L-3) TaxID=1071383 RepID=J7SAB3_HUIN7|nr:hypothetical protein KNAG_0K02460 [Kazachstania naganishii CBS 8797]CCK72609.1 hypothetical protein KNAG_0K02460 [Kazachstania naganishii CBS 8797]